jgi:hypothetical protein
VKSPDKRKIVHTVAALFFLVQIPVALLTDLKQSVPYLVFLSLWALVASHWSAREGAQAAKEAESE